MHDDMVSFSLLPHLRASQVIKVLEKAGFEVDRQKGSHVVMIDKINRRMTVVPDHRGKTIKKSLLMEIIKQTGLDVKGFLDLL
jgi:predicted RNA binding protein YcfA (HicA-like mRNA interferase family)